MSFNSGQRPRENKPKLNSRNKRYHGGKKKQSGNGLIQIKDDEDAEIEELQQRIQDEAPSRGSQNRNANIRFDSLPLSSRTQHGLQQSKMEVATDIQAAAVPHALVGRDILGAAKTGSGKTLAFVIPILEKLFHEKFTPDDGLGALVITPTRELALQIFEVLRTVGKKHQFSAGLITGGKKEFVEEQLRIIRMNILIATPGRLLQHLEQTASFDASRVMILVLDEADRILDLGFKTQLDSIISYLPTDRQTLLFSATQTKSVKDLARLSLQDAEYLSVHADEDEVTPKQLIQNYIVCDLPEKLDILYSFIKSHLKSKLIVFFSTCSQVRYVYELFRGLQPGIPLTALHGKVKQDRRTLIYMDYLKKPAACMFATDIAARGLDFPNVDWVVQVDAPEDSAMYIHRVGRTARYTAAGRALLLLMPSEEQTVLNMLTNESNIPLKRLTVNPTKTLSVAAKAASLLAAHPDYRTFAKKAFTGYLRSLQLLPMHPVKDLSTLPLDGYAQALGLPFTPELPNSMMQSDGLTDEAREELREKKNVNRTLDKLKKQIKEAKEEKKRLREEKKKAKSGSSNDDEEVVDNKKSKSKKGKDGKEEEEDDDLLQVKQTVNWDDDMNIDASNGVSTTTATLPKKLKIDKDGKLRVKAANTLAELSGNTSTNKKKILFDEDGNEVEALTLINKATSDEPVNSEEMQQRIQHRLQVVKEKVDEGREEDENRDKQRLRDRRLKEKQARRNVLDGRDEEDGPVAMLANAVEDKEGDEESDDNSGSDDSENESNDGSDVEDSDNSHGDSDEEGDQDSEEDEGDSDEEDEEDDEDDDRHNKRRKINAQEELVLQMLNAKKKK